MVRTAAFDGETAELRRRLGTFVSQLAAARSAGAEGAIDLTAVTGAVAGVASSHERTAALIVSLEKATAAVASDFATIDHFLGPENVAGLVSEGARHRMRGARTRRLALDARLDAILDEADALAGVLEAVAAEMALARSACEDMLERLAGEAIAASGGVENAERELGSIGVQMAGLERRLGPATKRDAAVALAEEHAYFGGERRALAAQAAALRDAREEVRRTAAAAGPVLAELSDCMAAVAVLRSKLVTDLELAVMLHSAVCERLRLDNLGGVGEVPPAAGRDGLVGRLVTLRNQGALGIRETERRKQAADEAFAGRFPGLFEPQPAEDPQPAPKPRWRFFRRRSTAGAGEDAGGKSD